MVPSVTTALTLIFGMSMMPTGVPMGYRFPLSSICPTGAEPFARVLRNSSMSTICSRAYRSGEMRATSTMKPVIITPRSVRVVPDKSSDCLAVGWATTWSRIAGRSSLSAASRSVASATRTSSSLRPREKRVATPALAEARTEATEVLRLVTESIYLRTVMAWVVVSAM